MRLSWLTALLLAGCTVDQLPAENLPPTASRTACLALEGLTFRATTPGECGLGPDGPTSCHWTLVFEADSPDRSGVEWTYSDVQSSDWVRCEGTRIISVGSAEIEVGTFDESTLEISWDGRRYAPVL